MFNRIYNVNHHESKSCETFHATLCYIVHGSWIGKTSKVNLTSRKEAIMTANQIAFWQLQRQKAFDQRTADETERSNKAREQETRMHNLITRTETERSNRAKENLEFSRNQETQRHNQATERNATYVADEQARHNKSMEGIQTAGNVMNFITGVGKLASGFIFQ